MLRLTFHALVPFSVFVLLALGGGPSFGQTVTASKSCTLLIHKDAHVSQGNLNTSYGDNRFLRMGPEMTEGAQNAFRVFLEADLTDPCTETGVPLPADGVLDSAHLRLYTNNGPGIDQQHDVARVVEAGAWAESTIAWNNQPGVVAAPTATKLVNHKNRWLNEWDVTSDVALFLGGTTNNGWRIAMQNEDYNPDGRRNEYLSRDYTSHVDHALAHPRLQIHYTVSVDHGTISDLAAQLPNPTLDRFTVSSQCEAGVDVYQMPYGRNKLLVGKDLAGQISLRDISDSLLFLDHADERFAVIFGYAHTQDVPAREPEIRLCSEINNAGTANMGIGMPSSMYLGSSTDDGRSALADFLFTLAHERIHTWQHRRGSLFMQANDAGHAQLVGLEPGFYQLARQGFLGGKSMPPELRSFAIYHSAMDRYLADPTRTWQTFFSPGALADYEAGTAPLTDDVDRQLIYSGVFEWIRKVHGEAGLRALHEEVEALRIANGWTDFTDFPDRTADERNDFFLEALIGGLQVDAADYFAHWKMPISSALQTYSDTFPIGPGAMDTDADGFTPLEGDFNDNDGDIFPRAPELLDAKDNNSDGQIDELVLVDDSSSDLSASPAENPVTLPLTLFGEISSLADVDSVRVTLAEKTLVTVILRAVDSDSTVINGSGKEVFTFVGKVELDGTYVGQPNVTQLQHVALSEVLFPGTHDLSISAAAFGSIPANPGEYVLQVFANTFDSPGMDGLEGSADFDYRLANELEPSPGFSCDDVIDGLTGPCETLQHVFQNLGGNGWRDSRGWLSSNDICTWKGIRCDDSGVQRLLLDGSEGRDPAGLLESLDWSPLADSVTALELDGTGVGAALPSEFATFNLETFRFDPSGQLCVPADLRGWFDAIPDKSGDLPDCCAADGDADGVFTCDDNCPLDSNADQADSDGDQIGDACDLCEGDNSTGDADNDGICRDTDCDDSDGLGISCGLFRDGFESSDTSAWTSTAP